MYVLVYYFDCYDELFWLMRRFFLDGFFVSFLFVVLIVVVGLILLIGVIVVVVIVSVFFILVVVIMVFCIYYKWSKRNKGGEKLFFFLSLNKFGLRFWEYGFEEYFLLGCGLKDFFFFNLLYFDGKSL